MGQTRQEEEKLKQPLTSSTDHIIIDQFDNTEYAKNEQTALHRLLLSHANTGCRPRALAASAKEIRREYFLAGISIKLTTSQMAPHTVVTRMIPVATSSLLFRPSNQVGTLLVFQAKPALSSITEQTVIGLSMLCVPSTPGEQLGLRINTQGGGKL